MKELLIQTARRTGIVDADQLSKYLEENSGQGRIDEVLLTCPFFTEDIVLKLFAEALGWEYLSDIPSKAVPVKFIENVPATYAQHHFLIGIKSNRNNGELSGEAGTEDDVSELTVVLSKPLDANALDNVSKMTGLPVKAALSFIFAMNF